MPQTPIFFREVQFSDKMAKTFVKSIIDIICVDKQHIVFNTSEYNFYRNISGNSFCENDVRCFLESLPH